MSLEEKLGQLAGVWVTPDGDDVAPYQHELSDDTRGWHEMISDGLGQITRLYGTVPLEALEGAQRLAAGQRQLMEANEWGIPAMAHEECLAGVATWGATAFPVPMAWGASFDPPLVREMAGAIGRTLRALGVHQGLAPVLDVVRDPRWGRVEESIGEDPYLIGSVGAAYVAGLEAGGVVSTLKHFAGYSASRAGRNHAPVSMGPREFRDIMLPPFEMALRLGGARSVMHAYTDIDGMPSAADQELLTRLLREEWGFTGVVVADYFGISFLELLHNVATDAGDAAAQSLTAGVDMELPTVRCYGGPLARKVRSGEVDEAVVDRALERVLRQKCELGLLDPDWSPDPPILAEGTADLDPEEHRALARRLAQESVVLLANPAGTPPLTGQRRVAVVGPLADDPLGMLGCYSFDVHVGTSYPDLPLGVEIPSVATALRERLDCEITVEPGCDVRDEDRTRLAEARRAADDADVCLLVVGDRAGLFGRGTSGEGCDAADLSLPGVQEELVADVLDGDTPVVLVVISGRPYALGEHAHRATAVLQTFFPGEEGARALVDVLTGAVTPSGRLPIAIPARPDSQPAPYLTSRLGQKTDVSALDPTPLYAFGHGLSYTTFAYTDLTINGQEAAEIPTDGTVEIGCTVHNTGARDGAEVVQLYLTDVVAQVTRPVHQLAGFARVEIPAGESRTVRFELHADRTSFTGRAGHRIVEPGRFLVHVGGSSADTPLSGEFTLVGVERTVGPDRVLHTPVTVMEPTSETLG